MFELNKLAEINKKTAGVQQKINKSRIHRKKDLLNGLILQPNYIILNIKKNCFIEKI